MAGSRKIIGGFQGEMHPEGKKREGDRGGGCGRQTRIRWGKQNGRTQRQGAGGEQQGRVAAPRETVREPGGGAAGRFLSDSARR